MAEEQHSRRALQVTNANFEAPFETAIVRFGIEGLNLNDAVDALKANQLSRMVNVTHRSDMGVTTRQGMFPALTSGGTDVHSFRVLDTDAGPSEQTTIVGVDTSVYMGTGVGGAMSVVSTGHSGEPLSMVPLHPPLSGEPWMYIADSDKMVKVRQDGYTLPVGLPAPNSAGFDLTTSVVVPNDNTNTKNIANFLDDSSAPGSWVGTHGRTILTDKEIEEKVAVIDTIAPLIAVSAIEPPGGTDTATFILGPPVGTVLGEGSLYDFWNLWGVGINRDLSIFDDATHPITDDDYIHLWLRLQNTAAIKEVRIYFIPSQTYWAPDRLPGEVDGSGITWNTSAFYVSILPPDPSGALNALQLVEQERIDARNVTVPPLDLTGINGSGRNPAEIQRRNRAYREARERQRALASSAVPTISVGPGSGTWNEYGGAVGLVIRRGDFQQLGGITQDDWSDIVGMQVYAVGAKGAGVTTDSFQISDVYVRGGDGLDSGDSTSIPYEYTYTHYDTLTGVEGNPPIETDARGVVSISVTDGVNAFRQAITVTPGEAYGNDHTVQRFYRRGGTLPLDYYFVGQNTVDGGPFVDEVSDTEAVASITIETDNNEPVATVDETGATVLAQPINSLWGPVEGFLIGCGDPYRPGHIYFSKPGNPDSWPPQNITEVSAPSEHLMMGCTFAGQAYVFSNDQMYALYPNLSGDTPGITATPTQCKKGLARHCRTGLTADANGIFFVAIDGIYRTTGGPPEWLSEDIDPIFRMTVVETKNGVAGIDLDRDEDLRLAVYENELYFSYYDALGVWQCMVYNLAHSYWRLYNSALSFSCLAHVEHTSDDQLVFGSKTNGTLYSFGGPWDDEDGAPPSDDGSAIDCVVRTGALDGGRPREEKRLGDQILDMNPNDVELTLQNFYNNETDSDAVGTMPTASERSRIILNSFGTTPIRAFNIATEIAWSTTTVLRPILYYLGTSAIIEPDVTTNRVTQWDDLQNGDEVYLTGITLDVDTGGEDRIVLVEVDFDGQISTAYTATVNCNGRHKVKFSWPAVQAHKVRLRPADPECAFWLLYRADWIFVSEPARIAKWDSYFENGWDQYHTGLDLYCDTFGLDKTIEVYADEVLIKTETVNTDGRLVHHITLPWGRAHVYHFIATDNNPGLLYGHRWHLDPEPSEQTNWNQNFTVAGIESGKYLKALVFQCDTFGQDKTVTVECDGVVVETLIINTNGRRVVQRAFPQHYGNVFRVYPTDDFNSRLYTLWWVFDQEPLALDRWETQEIDHRIPAWHYPIYGHITVRCTADVNVQIIAYNQSGVSTTKDYTIPSTAGIKQKCFIPFEAVKGILFKYIITSDDPFWLYREETAVMVRVWGSAETITAKPFGNDDLDATRVMTKAENAAARPGGGTGG